MCAVIFKAKIKKLDNGCSKLAAKIRELAIDKYGCTEFTAVIEGNTEIAISYWPDEESIQSWKQDEKHLIAQEYGRTKLYESYQVQVVKIVREYSSDTL